MNDQHATTCLTHTNPDAASLVAAAALGEALTPADTALLSRIQAACAQCRTDVAEFAQIARMLPLSAPAASPSAALRDRIMAEAQRTPAFAAHQRPQTKPAKIRQVFRPWAVSGLLAAALVGMLIWNVALRNSITATQVRSTSIRVAYTSLFGDEDARECRFNPGNVPAAGRVFLAPTAGVLGVYAKQLPPPPPGSAYHLWMRQQGPAQYVMALELDQRNRVLIIQQKLPALDLAQPLQVFITLERSSPPAQPGPAAALCTI